MCGICGIIRFDQHPIDRSALARACELIKHRGPDHTGTYVSPNAAAAFGAVRLAIIDPSPRCHQPIARDQGRYRLAFNGAAYNFRELRGELERAGDCFTTDGDTEVVLAACARWGVDALGRCNGMWALAYYDEQSRSGFLARDRYGVKPLFYAASDRTLCFASELSALRSLGGGDRGINTDAVAQLVQFGYIAAPDAILHGALRLEPAHYLRFSERGCESPQRYYTLGSGLATIAARTSAREHSAAPSGMAKRSAAMTNRNAAGAAHESDAETPSTIRPAEYAENLEHDQGVESDYASICARARHLLADAVVRRRVSDVPLGAFLSGGLDSSIVVKHLAESGSQPVKTFSVGFADQSAYDETKYARIVARRFGTEHHELKINQQELVDTLPRVLDHLSEPVGDSSILPTAIVSAFARRHVTVSLAGDGGDELFGGYWRYLGHIAWTAYHAWPGALRRRVIEPAMAALGSSKTSVIGNRVRQFRKLLRANQTDAIARHMQWCRILSPQAEGVFRNASQSAELDRRWLERARVGVNEHDRDDALNRIMRFDMQTSLPYDMLQKVDLASMMHALEVRLPFLDPTVVQFALSLPSSFKVHRGTRKRILLDAYRGHLPDAILDRPKRGFEVPFGELIRGPLLSMFRDVVTRSAVESFEVLSFDGVERVLSNHLDRTEECADVLFALLSLCWWKRQVAGK